MNTRIAPASLLLRVALVVCAVGLAMAAAGPAQAAPIIPSIEQVDFAFGARNVLYSLNGLAPDTLIAGASSGGEATTVWNPWPAGMPAPVWYDDGAANGLSTYGGDVRMNVLFDGHDELNAPLTVSLTGRGGNAAGADFEIWGSLTYDQPNVLLWALELTDVSLYAYADQRSAVLEGVGRIVGGAMAVQLDLVDTFGAIRGHVDISAMGPPAGYDPLSDSGLDQFNLTYTGETGATTVPEPTTVALLAVGGLAGLAGLRPGRRHRKR